MKHINFLYFCCYLLLFLNIKTTNLDYIIESNITEINNMATYTLTINRNIQSTGSTISVQPVNLNTIITIQFPIQFNPLITTTPIICQDVLNNRNVSCNINNSNRTIIINDYYSNNNFLNDQTIKISISSIENPSKPGQSSLFNFTIVDTSSNIIDNGPLQNFGILSRHITFVGGNFQSCLINANNSKPLTLSTLIFELNPSNKIPSTGKIIITLPQKWKDSFISQSLVSTILNCNPIYNISSSIQCSNEIISGNKNNQITITTFTNNNLQLSSSFSFTISSIRTQPYIDGKQTISISSAFSDGTIIDVCSVPMSGIIADQLTSFTLTTTNNVVQSSTQVKLQLQLSQTFIANDTIILKVPQSFITNQINSIDFSPVTVSQSLNQLTLTFQFSSTGSGFTRPSPHVMELTLLNVKNPISTQSVTITVSFKRSNLLYQQSSKNYQAIAATNNVNFTITNDAHVNTVGKGVLQISTNLTFPIGTLMILTYQPSISVNNKVSSTVQRAVLNTNIINGVTYTVSDNKMSINNLFISQFSTGSIQVEVNQFYNPTSIKPTVYTLSFSKDGFQILKAQRTITSSLISLKSVEIVASSYKVLDISVTYTFTLNTSADSTQISIILPKQLNVSSSYSSTCSSACSLNDTNMTFEIISNPGIVTISWGNNNNSNSFKTSNIFQIFTYYRGWAVQRSTLTLTMNQTTQFLQSSIIPSSKKNSDNISVTIIYIVPYGTPSGIITIQFPNDLNLNSAFCIQCTVIGLKVSFNYDINQGNNFMLVISSIINSLSKKTIGNFTSQLLTNENDQSLFSTSLTWTNTELSQFTTQINGDGFRAQQTQFNFQVSGLSTFQSYLLLNVGLFGVNIALLPAQATLRSNQVRLNLTGTSSISFQLYLTTPMSETYSSYNFSLKTYASDGSQMGQSVNNLWEHSCIGTNCRTCENTNKSICLSCYAKISAEKILNTADGTCIRQCPVNFFNSSDNLTCTPCDSNCLDCISVATQCISCNANNYLQSNSKKCVDICPVTYYASNLTNTCQICKIPCTWCDNSNNISCTMCGGSYFLFNRTCLLSCPRYYVSLNSNFSCIECDANCLQCSINPDNCTTCNNTQLLYLQNNKCVSSCITNSFIKNDVCTKCQSPCRICHNSTTTCSKCQITGTDLILYYEFTCISLINCNNLTSFYANFSNASCDSCPSQCSTCNDPTNCTSCMANFNLYLLNCISTCPNTTYSSLRICVICLSGCSTCLSQKQCTSCNDGLFLLNSSCYTTCPNNTFSSNTNCQTCPIQCTLCVTATICSECIANYHLYQSLCYNGCPNGTYDDTTLKFCLDCPSSCTICSSSDSCSNCINDYSLQNSLCVLHCQAGISFNQICYPCGPDCSSCQNTTCKSCNNSMFVLNGGCVVQCGTSMISLNNINCVPCSNKYNNCTTCNESQCLSCDSGQLLNGSCHPCSLGLYSKNSLCFTCPIACTECQNESYCTSCISNNYIQNNYCVENCPSNKVPNGTICSFCLQSCTKCNLTNSLCSVCQSGKYLYQQRCVTQCPSPLVISYYSTSCITQQQFYSQFSSASKIILFPFSISTLIILLIVLILKCYYKLTNLFTLSIAFLGFIQLGSWILFLYIEFIVYTNGHLDGLKGIICTSISILSLFIITFIHLHFYFKYISIDVQFIKWIKNNFGTNIFFLILSIIINFKIYRIVYSKLLGKDGFNMQLISPNKLLPFSIVSIFSIIFASIPLFIGTSLSLYFSISQDQQFYIALDTLCVTGIIVLFLLLDLYHPSDYFNNEIQAQNVKNKMYGQDNQHISIDQQSYNPFHGQNISKQQLLQPDIDQGLMTLPPSQKSTNKKIKNQINQKYDKENILESGQETNNNNNNNNNNNTNTKQQLQEQSRIQDEQNETKNIMNWIPKQFDHNGYLIKYDDNGDIQKYDQNGYKIKIDQDGKHHKYDQKGYQIIIDKKGNFIKYNQDGYIIGNNNKIYDQRGYQVINNNQGNKQFYDSNGYQVKNINGLIYLFNTDGNKIIIDKQNIHHKYNQQGYQIIQQNGQIIYKNNQGLYMRLKNNNWQIYDPQDGYILKQNQNGIYIKYDDDGFFIKKDQFNNYLHYDQNDYRIIKNPNGEFQRYDQDDYRVIKDNNGIQHRYDKEGFQMKIVDGKNIFYDGNGYRVERDFYGAATLYDNDGNIIVIDEVTGEHHKYNNQGLQIVKDGQNYYLCDKRGNRVNELNDGSYQKYDKDGNKIWLDQDGYEIQHDDDGNLIRYNKVGDKVITDISDVNDQIQEEKERNNEQNEYNKIEKTKKNKFKNKEIDLQNEYKNMIQQIYKQKNEIISNNDDEQNLIQFHDIEIYDKKQLEQQYQNLKNNQMQIQIIQDKQIKLNQLNNINYKQNINFKQKNISINNNNNKLNNNNQNKKNKILSQQCKLSQNDIKSIIDQQIDQRIYENNGIEVINNNISQMNSDEIESINDIKIQNYNNNNNNNKNKKKRNQQTEMNFNISDKKDTKTQYNYNSVQIGIKNKNNIYDQQDQLQSLHQDDWDINNQQQPAIFYKNKQFSHANTNDNNNIIYVEDQQNLDDNQDALSDYIKVENNYRYDDGILSGRNMQSIQQVQDQLFGRIGKQDNGIRQRKQFKLSGSPNPLLQYAKKIEVNKKSIQQKMYLDNYKK